MYQVDDVVVYGNHGVCRVTNIGTLSMSQASEEKLYYTLMPIFHKDAILYAPVENQKTVMRDAVTKQEANELLSEMQSIDTVKVESEKERETAYKQAIFSADLRSVVSLLKTIHQRREKRTREGKKLTMLDEKYFRMAENQLLEELSYGLGKDKNEIFTYIDQQVFQG